MESSEAQIVQAAKIQHLAIYVKNTEALADFYRRVFGMIEVSREPDGQFEGEFRICLSDGNINLALVPSTSSRGLDHIGFQVEDVASMKSAAIAMGGRLGRSGPRQVTLPEIAHHQGFILDPTGTRIDLTKDGWGLEPTASGRG